jgi:hypothetical protein
MARKREFISEHQLSLHGIAIPVTIRLYKSVDGERIEFEQSHYIKTPLQEKPYKTDYSWGVDEKKALTRVMRTINEHYDEAVRKGHKSSESWLIPNEYFLTKEKKGT